MRFCKKQPMKSMSFTSWHLNKEKYNKIKTLAETIRDYQNLLSKQYYNRYYKNHVFINYKDFYKEMKQYHQKDIGLSFFQHACIKVYNVYNKKKPPKKMVEFKALTFDGINLMKIPMFEYSNNKYSNAVINFNIPHQEIIEIPFRHSNKYHVNLNDIHYSLSGPNKCQLQKQYTCKVMLNGKIKITIAIDDDSSLQIYTKNVIEGVDVNVKHNLFQLSNGYNIDYDKKLLKKVFKQQKKIDEIKSHKKSLGLSKKFGTRLLLKNQKNRNRVTNMLEKKIVELFKYCNEHNIDHLIFEKLSQFNGKNYSTNEEFNVNYNRLVRALHLADVKNMALRIGKKYGITISLTNPKYTSQQCSVCGYISHRNRNSQEHFCCKHCGHTENADYNAAKNIKHRIQSNVLRELLHEEININQYEMIDDEKEYSFKESLLLATYLDNY